MIVQYVEPDFMDSIDSFSRADSLKVKAFLIVLIDHIENSESIDDLVSIDYSDFNIYGPLTELQESNPDLSISLPENPPSSIVTVSTLRGKLTDQNFPNMDLYLFKFDNFRLIFSLRGQVCTFLRVEGNSVSLKF